MQQPKAYTVAAITRMIKEQLESTFAGIWIEGEISNYIHHGSGHRYFSLKDDRAALRVTIWRSVGSYLKFEPKDGQKILAFGDITVYDKAGQYQLNCRKLIPVGVGELELAFRQLHEKLSAEGLFDPELKQPIPPYPMTIGVVTSPTGAALRDIMQISRRRNNAVQLIVYPAQVQGDGAEDTIAAGIEYFNSRDDIDLIIAGRGGGSLEDLWCFNTEVVVRGIVASRLPVISAVGHEVDTTLSDLAADLRAPTPSAAAELAVWSREECADWLDGHIQHTGRLLAQQLERGRQAVDAALSRPVFRRPLNMVRQRGQQHDILLQRLTSSGKKSLDAFGHRLSLTSARLEAMSPLKILARGYSVSRKVPSGQVVTSHEDILPGDRLETILAKGRLVSFVESVKKRSEYARKKEV